MKLLDERGIGTVWSICKEKFALAGHTHNYAGSESAGGPANSAMCVADYGQTDKTIQIGYSGTGITGDQIKYIAGYTDGSGNVNAKIKDVSKDALRAWLGLGSLAYSSSSIPTKVSQLTNDEGFITGYTLPTASDATLGGIKTGYGDDITGWAVEVDNDSNAYVSIPGLFRNVDNDVYQLMVGNSTNCTIYTNGSISRGFNGSSTLYGFPAKGGTFALTSDCLTAKYVSSYPYGSDWRKIIYSSAQQIILLDESNGYDVSNWYKASEVGNVLDLYFCGAVGGVIQSDQSNLFKIADGSQLKSLNTINISPSKSYRLIRLIEGVLVVAYSIPNIG